MRRRGRFKLEPVAQAVVLGLLVLLGLAGMAGRALALDPIIVTPATQHIEITKLGVFYEGRGERISVETAPDSNSASSRVEFRARVAGANTNWFVFAIRNTTGQQIDLWVTADRYSFIGSGFSSALLSLTFGGAPATDIRVLDDRRLRWFVFDEAGGVAWRTGRLLLTKTP